MDELTRFEQETWEHYNKIEAENYHLKRQLTNKNKEIKNLKKSLGYFKMLLRKENENKKPRYRNNGKGRK